MKVTKLGRAFASLAIFAATMTSSCMSPGDTASAKIKAKCSKIGLTKVVNKITFTCSKSGKNLIWSKSKITSTTTTSVQATLEKFSFKYNLDSSLPSDFVAEFQTVMKNLGELTPIESGSISSNKSSMDVYSWKSTTGNPFQSQIGDITGSSISGNQNKRFMVLEIPALEFDQKLMHRYSVIPHEYFHVYQLSLAKKDLGAGKWIIEGGAATFESLYIQQYYGYNYFKDAQTNVGLAAINNPQIFETYGSEEINYGSSVFLVLALVKELQKLNYSEQQAFRMVYRDFWIEFAKQSDWKIAFDKIFPVKLADFYQSLLGYTNNINSVLPSESLRLQTIFSS